MRKDGAVTFRTFRKDWGKEGYGIALMQGDKVINPYLGYWMDEDEFGNPHLSHSGDKATVLDGKYKGCYIIFHSGMMEEIYNKQKNAS